MPKERFLGMRRYVGMGKQTTDAVSGDPVPYALAVRQRGGWVHQDPREGSLDREEKE